MPPNNPSPRLTAIQRRHVRSHALLISIAFVLFWIPVVIFAKLADDVIEHDPIGPDSFILNAVHSIHSAGWDSFFLFLTALGEPAVVASVAFALFGVLLYRHNWRAAAMILAGVGGAGLANLILKAVFMRSRPSIFTPLVHETSYSFPSGHSMVSAAFVISLMLILWHTRYRIPAIVLGLLATGLIGLSRIYLGVHYPSDVLAGWSVGLVWAVLAGSVILNRPFGIGRRLAPLLHRG